MNFFDHKDLGNHLLQLCPKVVKQPVYIYIYIQLASVVLSFGRAGMELSSQPGQQTVN